MSPTTTVPSKSPTERPITSTYPTSSPSALPTASLSTPFEEIVIDKAGIYNDLEGKSNFIISGEGSFEFVSDRNSDDKKIYTILPAKNSITITNFNVKHDQISLFHFPVLYSLNDLPYRTSPLQFFLSSEQRLVLLSCDATDLTEENFIFHSNTNEKEKKKFQFSLLSIISLGLLVGCGLHFAFLAKMNEKDDDDKTKIFLEMSGKDENDDELLLSSDFGSVSSLKSEMQESDSLQSLFSSDIELDVESRDMFGDSEELEGKEDISEHEPESEFRFTHEFSEDEDSKRRLSEENETEEDYREEEAYGSESPARYSSAHEVESHPVSEYPFGNYTFESNFGYPYWNNNAAVGSVWEYPYPNNNLGSTDRYPFLTTFNAFDSSEVAGHSNVFLESDVQLETAPDNVDIEGNYHEND
jgi:hypothetical protein